MRIYTHTSINNQNLYGIVSIDDGILKIKFSVLRPSDIKTYIDRPVGDPLRTILSHYEDHLLHTLVSSKERDQSKQPVIRTIQVQGELPVDLLDTARQVMRVSALKCIADFLDVNIETED